MSLTAKQARFVEEYLIDLNATQAAIRAGYSEKGATVRGAELLANRKVSAAVEAAKGERPEAVGVAHGDQLVVGQQQEAEGALELRERVEDLIHLLGAAALRDQVEDQLGVGGRLEERAPLAEGAPQLAGVREVAVVRERDVAVAVVDHEGLDVGLVVRGAGGRVAVVADGGATEELRGEDIGVVEHVEDAVSRGAELRTGGGTDGLFFEPTVLDDVTEEMEVAREETFGPVTPVIRAADYEEAIEVANRSRYGLQAGVFTNDLKLVWRAYAELEVGGLIINDVPTWRVDHMPYGGVKQSGFGREGLKYAIEEMTERRLMVIRTP